MTVVEEYHDTDPKQLLGGVTTAANQTAQQDLTQALDSLFNHPNVAPFIGKQLIQRLVTSNPSPEYVARVSKAFNDNGQGVRGDLSAVIKAILLDDEARNGHQNAPTTFGKLREPLVQAAHIWRTFKVYSPNNRIQYYNANKTLNQAALSSPSVFNFFSPSYAPHGELKQAKLIAPEFEILTENASIRLNNFFNHWVLKSKQNAADAQDTDNLLNLDREIALLSDAQALLDHLDLVLMAGQMPDNMKQVLIDEFQSNDFKKLSDFKKVTHLLFLIVNTPQYAIQK